MNKRRLLKLADLLEADAKNKKGIKFDLGGWGKISNITDPVSCGTTACAMGLAVASGAFRRAGLDAANGLYAGHILVPRHDGFTGFRAAASLFSISESDAAFLFHDSHYGLSKTTGAAGERSVAKRIRDFVAGKVSA